MKKPIDREYLTDTLKTFDSEVSEKKYLRKDEPSLHTHANKTALDKIGETSNGTLLFNGQEISNGLDGTDGKDGANGADGRSAYDIAVEHGFQGTEAEWLEALKGEKGEPGKDGVDGQSGTVYDVLATSEAVKENTVEGKLVDALVVKEVFQSVSDGKELIASAITDKGVEAGADDTFEVMAGKIKQISSSGIAITLDVPTNVTLTSNIASVTLKWTDPEDILFKNVTLAEWAGTIIVRKEGSAPMSQSDGVIVADSKIRNQYKTDGIVDVGLENDITYYYGIFPYTSTGVYNYEYTKDIVLTKVYIAPSSEINNWSYTLDDENSIVTLNRHINESIPDVIVYAYYTIDDKIYKTQLTGMMFYTRKYIKTIKFNKYIDTTDFVAANHMFYNCESLIDVDLGDIDISNITNTNMMFAYCYSLTNINLSGLNTHNVTSMSLMFCDCSSLTTLDLSSFNTSNVSSMRSMFKNTPNLKSIYVSRDKWIITENTDVADMFTNCGTSSVTYI